jgi:LmbE family N-acetylglucosaminyl deacetylase
VTSDGLSYAMVVAHPDDDAYGAAGPVALHANDPGFRFILIHATDGEETSVLAFPPPESL